MADQEGDFLEISCCEMHTLPVADVFSKEKRSWVMSRITGKDTKPELLLRSMLHRRGFRLTVNGPKNKKLPGRPLLGICFWRKGRGKQIPSNHENRRARVDRRIRHRHSRYAASHQRDLLNCHGARRRTSAAGRTVWDFFTQCRGWQNDLGSSDERLRLTSKRSFQF